MASKDDEFLQSLRATFRVEAAEHLQAIAQGLVALEASTEPEARRKLIETIFRAAHSLKGAARAVNFIDVETICQSLEDTFSSWKQGKSTPSAATMDAAHGALDAVSAVLGASPEAQAPIAADSEQEMAVAQPAAATEKATADTVRITVDKLDARLLEAEEMLTAKLSTAQHAVELGALALQFEPWRKQWSKVQPQARALRASTAHGALAEFLEWNNDYLRALEGKVTSLRQTAERDRNQIGKLVDELVADSRKLLMLPVATVSGLFAKLVRDLARDQGKEVEFIMVGSEAEIDRRILEEMKDPLIHLLRNAIDHGVEAPMQRRLAGKPERATLRLEVAALNGSHVHIDLSDDGAGIDVARLKASAVKHGTLTAEAARELDDTRALELVFEPDVSTSPIITELSGRGLGLAIVREKTEKLGGQVTVQSQRGAGTTIGISLPLTLATFRGILIGLAQRTFVLPTTEVERVIRFRARDVQTVKGRETLTVNGRAVALVRMADVLQLAGAAATGRDSASPAVLLGTGEHRTAFAVDTVLDEQEVLVKQLVRPLERVRNIAGATVLGSGQIAPILRVSDLLKSARMAGAPARAAVESVAVATQARSVLVAEDSITSRLLLKGILESAGYRVRTAVDGMDAYTALRTGEFDLVVSDVEMPRLNGFDLTARIRADRRLAELPVILVTALEKREDRERGVEAGANAYLVKSSLDQSNLLEAVRRLMP
jgi:two-component system chemotaxis sensor kinase CheA